MPSPSVLARLKSLLPGGWFADPTPVADGVLSGFAALFTSANDFISFARLQTRLRTATGGFLDLAALDYFGGGLARRAGETDAPYRARLLAQLFLEKATRRGLSRALETLTGRAPVIFEPARPADTGGYGVACGYGAAGGYGSLLMPYQALVTAYRPAGQGVPLVAGYGSSTGGYSTPSRASYASIGQVTGPVTDASILALIDSVMPAATVAWSRILS